VARGAALATAIAASLLAVAGAGGTATQQTPKRGGTIVVASPVQEPACFNDLLATCNIQQATRMVLNEVLEGAFEIAPDLSYRPNLVSRVEVQREPFALTYHIRPEARWSDGTPVTAADFAFTYQAAVDPKLGSRLAGLYDGIRAVRRIGAKTVGVEFERPRSDWRALFHTVLPRHVLGGADLRTIWRDGISDPKTGRPIASGPFMIGSWERGRRLTFRRNPRFWGPHPAYLDALVFRFDLIDPIRAAEALRRSEVDLIYPQYQPELAELRREQGLAVGSKPGLTWENIPINLRAGGHPALRSPFVRQAIAYGIDRDAIVRDLFGSVKPEPRPLHSIVFFTNSSRYEPHWSLYGYRVAQARRLLESNGCSAATDGIYMCDGVRLSFRLVTTAPNPRRARVVQLVQSQLLRLGIEIVPQFAAPLVFFDTILRGGDFDLALFAWVGSPEPASNVAQWRCGSSSNWTGYCSRLVSRDLDQGSRSLVESRSAGHFNRADTKMARQVPTIPLYQLPTFAAFTSKLRGFVENPTEECTFWSSENWWLAE
jgi:peptide/nickel transport system substrate-binding protein